MLRRHYCYNYVVPVVKKYMLKTLQLKLEGPSEKEEFLRNK